MEDSLVEGVEEEEVLRIPEAGEVEGEVVEACSPLKLSLSR
jgi:hypothetical protein